MTTLGYPNIAFVGKAGSGKSSAAGILQDLALPIAAAGYSPVSFATPVKRMSAELWPAGRRDRWQALGAAVREIDPNTWVGIWACEVEDSRDWPIVTDDVRYENEWWAARAKGFVIVRVWAPEHVRINRLKANGKWQDAGQLLHESETAVDHMVADYTIENSDGSLIDLAAMLLNIINKELRRA